MLQHATILLGANLTVYLLLLIFCLLILWAWTHNGASIHRESCCLPPGPAPLPLIGNLHQIRPSNLLKSLKMLSEKYGPVFTVHLGFRHAVVLWGYDAVKEALVDQGEAFSGRGSIATLESVLQDYGVNFAQGARWKELRRFTVMTMGNLGVGKRSVVEKIREEAQHLINEFQNQGELPFDPTFHLSNAAANVTCSVIFGNRFDYQDNEFHELLRLIDVGLVESSGLFAQLYNMFTNIMELVPGPHQKAKQALKNIERFIERRVEMNQKTFDPNAPRNFIDHFLIKMEKEKENPSTEYFMKNLVIIILGLFLAGTTTISITIRHALLFFLKYPEIEEKVFAEIDCVIGRNRIPTIGDRSKMPYTDAVIHEIQRFTDLVPLGAPRRVVRDTNFRGFMLPKGIEIYPILSSVHWDPTHFKDPETFDPGHFLDENGRFKKNDAFMPFSAGKRICPGESVAKMALFIYITAILQTCKLVFHGDPKDIDIRPRLNGFVNIPVNYDLKVIPR
ncbi:cytochrome P450 2G1-like [Ambystoma mexicanum]|uniref:cytochrome P450 2G1-like n=1 Tax=Ambystoma mexicanum TaxID=8296 RepID=UPI0037E92572